MSDSSYSSATRHRQPYSKAGRLPTLDIVDDEWAADTLSDDEVNCDIHEAAIASLLDEGDLDVDTVVVSAGHSGSAASSAAERRKREEGRWNDMGLDNFTASSGNNVSTTFRQQNNVEGGSNETGTSTRQSPQ